MDDHAIPEDLAGGPFTTAEAMMHGVTREALSRAVSAGRIRRLARGVYSAATQPARVEDRHLELCRGLLLEYPDAALMGRSAVVALGLPTWGVPLGVALLGRPIDRQLRRSGALIRPLDPSLEIGTGANGPMTSPAVSLVQLCLDHGTTAGVVSADAALRRGVVDEASLTAVVADRAGHRRVQRALAMTRLVDAGSESPGESRARLLLVTHGYEVESQHVVVDGDGSFLGRADLRISGTRVLVEFDGLVKYADGDPQVLVAEKLREDRLRAAGWIVVRLTWADLARPQQFLAAVARAVAMSTPLPAAG